MAGEIITRHFSVVTSDTLFVNKWFFNLCIKQFLEKLIHLEN